MYFKTIFYLKQKYWLSIYGNKAKFTLIFSFPCICMWCTCLCVYVWVHVCAHAYGGENLMLGVFIACFCTLFVEAESPNQAQSSSIWLVSLAGLLWGTPGLCLPRLELQEGCHIHLPLTWTLDIHAYTTYMDSGLHAYTANALPPNHSPGPKTNFF